MFPGALLIVFFFWLLAKNLFQSLNLHYQSAFSKIMQMKKKTAGVIGVGSFGLVVTVVVVQMWRLHAGNV